MEAQDTTSAAQAANDHGATLSTGDLARRTGTTLRTVRFYEEAGMLKPTSVAKGGRRLYTEADLERLTLITDLRELNLSLDEIKELLRMREGCSSAPELADRFGSALNQQLERTQQRLAALLRLRDEFSAALSALVPCRTCHTPLAQHACSDCGVVSKPEAPRIMKVVVGHSDPSPCGSAGGGCAGGESA
ncbi:MAG TPA: MerR family transcriptional regulator [Vulgatibacter sp.]